MDTTIVTIASLSVSGALLGIVLMLLLACFKKRISKCWQYYLWLIVIFRFIIPFTPEQSIVGDLFYFSKQKQLVKETKAIDTDFFQNETVVQPDVLASQQSSYDIKGGEHSLFEILFVCWLFATSVLFVKKLTSYQSFIHYIKASCDEIDEPEFFNIYSDVLCEMKLKKPIPIYRNTMAVSPMLVGIMRPFIVIPQSLICEEDLKNILRHELIHYKNKDALYKWLMQIVVCLHWFNPVVYFVSAQMNGLCELSCDEMVLGGLDEKGKKSYGNTLISSIKTNCSYKNNVVSVTLHEDSRKMKERLEAIMNYKQKTKCTATIGIFVAISLCLGATVFGAYSTNKIELAKYDNQKYNTETVKFEIENDDVHISGKSYYRNIYFENKYFIDLAWNADLSQYEVTSQIMPNQKPMTIAFSEKASLYAKNADVLEAVQLSIENKYSKHNEESSFMTMTSPVVLHVEGPFQENVNELAEEFYKTDNLVYFLAVVTKLEPQKISSFIERSYTENKIDYFSILDLSPNLMKSYAEKSYLDDKINFFSMMDLTAEETKKYAEKSYLDDKINFFSMLDLTAEETKKYAEKSYLDDKINFFSMLDLTAEETKKYAEKSYLDNKINFFTILMDEIGSEQENSFLQRAEKDGKKNFSSVLSDW